MGRTGWVPRRASLAGSMPAVGVSRVYPVCPRLLVCQFCQSDMCRQSATAVQPLPAYVQDTRVGSSYVAESRNED